MRQAPELIRAVVRSRNSSRAWSASRPFPGLWRHPCFLSEDMHALRPRSCPAPLRGSPISRCRRAAFTLVQVMIATGIIALAGLAGVQALFLVNRKAAAMRMTTNARAVVQRNIDTALGVPFSAAQQPAILAITPSGGTVYDDDGNGDNLVNVVLMRDGTDVLVYGTLTRIVTAEPNGQNVDLRRITFQLDYSYRGQPYTYSMTTMRSPD